jgi:predicted CoA-binding protein
MDTAEAIQDFLRGEAFAVAGASTVRAKYGNKVLRCYLQNGRRAYPIHRNEPEIEGQTCYRDLFSLPEAVHGLSIITPPAITEAIVEDAAAAGITRVWMQPGAESQRAIDRARELGLTVIAGGPCLLVSLGFRENG